VNRTCDFPACYIVLQPLRYRVPHNIMWWTQIIWILQYAFFDPPVISFFYLKTALITFFSNPLNYHTQQLRILLLQVRIMCQIISAVSAISKPGVPYLHHDIREIWHTTGGQQRLLLLSLLLSNAAFSLHISIVPQTHTDWENQTSRPIQLVCKHPTVPALSVHSIPYKQQSKQNNSS
jgi:hypothetical protein